MAEDPIDDRCTSRSTQSAEHVRASIGAQSNETYSLLVRAVGGHLDYKPGVRRCSSGRKEWRLAKGLTIDEIAREVQIGKHYRTCARN